MELIRERILSVVYNLLYIQDQHQHHWMIFFFLFSLEGDLVKYTNVKKKQRVSS